MGRAWTRAAGAMVCHGKAIQDPANIQAGARLAANCSLEMGEIAVAEIQDCLTDNISGFM